MFSLNSKRFNMKLRFTPGGVVMVSLCLLTAVLFLGCPQPTSSGSDNPAPNLPPAQTASYMSMDASRNVYDLTITENTGSGRYTAKAGDSYKLIITKSSGTKNTSSGTVSNVSGTIFTLKPSKGTGEFHVTIGGGISKIDGTVTYDDNSSESVSDLPLTALDVDIPADLKKNFQSELTIGSWQYLADGFEVKNGVFSWYMDSTEADKLSGTIVAIIPEAGSEPNLAIFKISGATGYANSYTVGKYFAFAYKNLTPNAGVSMSTPYKSGGKNSGVDTIVEAIVEYTGANGYYALYGLYLPHTASAATLGNLKGKWGVDADDNGDAGAADEEYYIQIKGTTLIEWADSDSDAEYDGTEDATMLAEMGDIVDHTDASQTSGVLYIKIVGSDMGLSIGKYIAIAWKDLTSSTVAFMTDNTEYNTLGEVKAARYDPTDNSQFTQSGFYTSYRQ